MKGIPVTTEQVERIYSAYARFYDLVFGKAAFCQSRAWAIHLLEIQSGDKILEVGVGTGLSLSLYPRHCEIVGIDLSARMLEKGEKRVKKYQLPHVTLQKMDATTMEFEDNSFDRVLAAYVMTTVPDPKQVMQEMIRVCKDGGNIVLLNHFANRNPLVYRIEKFISPFCTKIGFRTDLDLKTLLDGTPLRVTKARSAPPFNYWKLVQCINMKNA